MSVTLIATMVAENPELIAKYRAAAGDALARHGGRVVAAGPQPALIEDSGQTAASLDALAVIAFPDQSAVRAWLDDPELADLHAMRQGGGRSVIYMLGA